ncbi:MAG TPA: hypothetical protein VF773_00455 [Verrucomicrobiae bacterium]
MNTPLVYLANGQLRMWQDSGKPQTIESRFGTDLVNKSLKEQQRHAWKQGGEGKLIPSSALWGKGDSEKPVQVALTSVCRGAEPAEFLYTLRTEHVCAILSVNAAKAEEQRIWNNNIKRIDHLDVHPTLGHVACSVEQKGGTANIGIRLAGDSGLAEVTEGDSVDTAPSWIPRDQMALIFQSAGVGRNKDGFIGGLGPFAIQQLEIENGEMTTLVEDSKFDLLTPRMTADGTLYYIKRPYKDGRGTPLDALKDVILFPFRLAHAIFGYLNIFSMLYSGKQLKTVKQHGAKNLDIPQMIVWGNLIKAQQGEEDSGQPSLVPKSWQLIRRSTTGEEAVVATSVLCYDLAADGTILHSNGSAIYALSPNGTASELVRDKLVQQVIALRPTQGIPSNSTSITASNPAGNDAG